MSIVHIRVNVHAVACINMKINIKIKMNLDTEADTGTDKDADTVTDGCLWYCGRCCCRYFLRHCWYTAVTSTVVDAIAAVVASASARADASAVFPTAVDILLLLLLMPPPLVLLLVLCLCHCCWHGWNCYSRLCICCRPRQGSNLCYLCPEVHMETSLGDLCRVSIAGH